MFCGYLFCVNCVEVVKESNTYAFLCKSCKNVGNITITIRHHYRNRKHIDMKRPSVLAV